ncbi:sensor domain-containing diguanylate cyclase [Pseudomonas japonica]|uniref:sensor domain-containing diguanylate cyclase n=1 Tax=Pseudomonas japonica TaxID=256466 RepID=UPI0015E322E3|nr:sensor domain-containing diguanylate cyclase [Pseudomonas japonica]MBA1245443.1 GGDEF domain-containing protein [Pseudomonas japonica]
MFRQMPRFITLRTLILVLTLTAAMSMLLASIMVAYVTYRNALIRHSLDVNEAYAKKIAAAVDGNILEGMSRLKYSAQAMARGGDQATEMDRLLHQDSTFNSILVVSPEGAIQSVLPPRAELLGETLSGWSAQLTTRASISSSFFSAAGNVLFYVSHPVARPNGVPGNVLVATINVKADSAFRRLLTEHSFHNRAFLYLVDGEGNYLYHPNESALGKRSDDDITRQALRRGEGGSVIIKDVAGGLALVGYAPIGQTPWGVVLKQPLQVADGMVLDLVKSMAWGILPLGLVGLGLTIWGATRISRPLRQLAEGARRLGEANSISLIKEAGGWYAEAWRIRRALLTGIGLMNEKLATLNTQAYRDPLTNLANRRALDETLANLADQGQPFSVLAADIDHFKRVNDTFGHNVGDTVLCRIAEVFNQQLRQGDLACRVGGEEFIIVLPNTPVSAAVALAERIRTAVQETPLLPGHPLTLSLGVATWNSRGDETVAGTLKQADKLLYVAKQSGRNRVASPAALLSAVT